MNGLGRGAERGQEKEEVRAPAKTASTAGGARLRLGHWSPRCCLRGEGMRCKMRESKVVC